MNPKIDIQVTPRFLEDQSQPEQGLYAFAYTVQLTNRGPSPVQLIARHWIISDGHGHTQEVKGLGVVGQQPLLPPGAQFEYTSGCPLPTPIGTMRGRFRWVDESGDPFDTDIPEFMLAVPRALH